MVKIRPYRSTPMGPKPIDSRTLFVTVDSVPHKDDIFIFEGKRYSVVQAPVHNFDTGVVIVIGKEIDD